MREVTMSNNEREGWYETNKKHIIVAFALIVIGLTATAIFTAYAMQDVEVSYTTVEFHNYTDCWSFYGCSIDEMPLKDEYDYKGVIYNVQREIVDSYYDGEAWVVTYNVTMQITNTHYKIVPRYKTWL